MQKVLSLPPTPEETPIPVFAQFAVGLGLPSQQAIQQSLTSINTLELQDTLSNTVIKQKSNTINNNPPDDLFPIQSKTWTTNIAHSISYHPIFNNNNHNIWNPSHNNNNNNNNNNETTSAPSNFSSNDPTTDEKFSHVPTKNRKSNDPNAVFRQQKDKGKESSNQNSPLQETNKAENDNSPTDDPDTDENRRKSTLQNFSSLQNLPLPYSLENQT